MKKNGRTSSNPHVGRPTDYDPKYCEEIITHMAEGLSKEAFAGSIGVSKQTLYDWMKAHEEFLDAVHIGEMKSLLWWERRGIKGMSEGKDFSPIPWKFGIANRHGWKDKSDVTSDDKQVVAGFVYNAPKQEEDHEENLPDD